MTQKLKIIREQHKLIPVADKILTLDFPNDQYIYHNLRQ